MLRVILLGFLLSLFCYSKTGYIYCEKVKNNKCKIHKIESPKKELLLSFDEYAKELIGKDIKITKVKYKYDKKIAVIYYSYK